MTISRNDVIKVIRLMNSAMAQTRREDAGKLLFQARDILNPHHISLEEVYEFNLTGNYPVVKQPEVKEPEEEPFVDETDVWVIPWTKEMETLDRQLAQKDFAHVLKMQDERFSTKRTKENIKWLYDIARRHRMRIPDEYYDFMKRSDNV